MGHIEARDITLTYDTPSGAVPGVHGVSFGMVAVADDIGSEHGSAAGFHGTRASRRVKSNRRIF